MVPHWTGSETTQQRMVRSGRFKLVYIHGHRPQLFDLEADPNELDDLGEAPAYAAVRAKLLAKVLAGWDPEAIARELIWRRQEKDLLTAWGAAAQPESQFVLPLEGRDSWLDDPPGRRLESGQAERKGLVPSSELEQQRRRADDPGGEKPPC